MFSLWRASAVQEENFSLLPPECLQGAGAQHFAELLHPCPLNIYRRQEFRRTAVEGAINASHNQHEKIPNSGMVGTGWELGGGQTGVSDQHKKYPKRKRAGSGRGIRTTLDNHRADGARRQQW
ncbi:hypothetical protein BY996DRAFT_6458040, partial [Phakopsora pachyrhizi]